MEAIFKKLEDKGENNVDGLIKWMKSAKIITSKDIEDKARRLLSAIPLEKFKEVLAKIAGDQHKTLEELTNLLSQASVGGGIADAVKSGAGALKNVFKMK